MTESDLHLSPGPVTKFVLLRLQCYNCKDLPEYEVVITPTKLETFMMSRRSVVVCVHINLIATKN